MGPLGDKFVIFDQEFITTYSLLVTEAEHNFKGSLFDEWAEKGVFRALHIVPSKMEVYLPPTPS